MRALVAGMLVALLLLLAADHSAAQQRTVETISNRFVKAHVITPGRSGRFWITAGPHYRDSIRFLYATNPAFVTSNIVFRVTRGGNSTYYTNQPDDYFPWKPTPSVGNAIYKPYDTMIVRADTLLLEWRGLSGFDITMRFIPEKQSTIYDTGGDMLLEFSYRLANFAPPADLGILMMFDTFNSQGGSADGGGMGDQPSVMTSRGYLPVNGISNSAAFSSGNMPEWYHVGNFLYLEPLNDIYPIHRLTGRSHGGVPLTPPHLLAIGNWYQLRTVAWDLPNAFASTGFGDCATIMRWEGLGGEGTVRTAFGLNDKGGNSNFTCRDDNIFVDIKAPRLITQAVANGPYTQEQFDVEMWATNLRETPVTTTIRLQNPVNSFPSYPLRGDRLILDSVATPAAQTVYMAPRQTVKLTWRMRVNTASKDTLVQLVFFSRNGTAMEKRFLEDCAPLITIKGWEAPPPPRDTLAPEIELMRHLRDSTMRWEFQLHDRHPGYLYDTGPIAPLEILTVENMTTSISQAGFVACDTRSTVDFGAFVTDTSRPASLTFRVTDCAGNDSIATLVYAPRPDTFAPEVVVVENYGSLGPPCNVRHYELTLLDQNHQTPEAGDHGFGTIVIETQDNFDVVINGGVPVRPFDKRATITADVRDSMRDGRLSIRVFDFAGNESIISYTYCTLPDALPPVSQVMPLVEGLWQVTTSDRRTWDRGLREIVILSNPGGNMRIPLPPVITPGLRETTFDVEAVDLTRAGEIVLEIRDTIYASEPRGHADTVRIVHVPGDVPPRDTVAPDITFVAAPGSGGANVVVTVDEMHVIDGVRYPHDTGLEAVWLVSATPNIVVSSPIAFTVGDTTMSFNVRVLDTLAIGIRDRIVISARDRAGNVSESSYEYPIQPDTRPPLVAGALSADRTTLEVTVADERQYDRGLGSVTLENGMNIAMRGSLPDIRGHRSETFTFDVADPLAPISGELVVHDLIGTIDQTPEGSFDHVVRIPFSLPSVALEVAMPSTVEGGDSVVAAIIARSEIDDDVDSLGFTLSYLNATGVPGIRTHVPLTSATSLAGRVEFSILPARTIRAGDTIATVAFATSLTGSVYDLTVATSNARVNGGLGRVIGVRAGNDSVLSTLALPPALITIGGDSTTWVNGECDRILTGRRAPARPNALAILGMRPQPIVRSGGAAVELDLRNLPSEGAIAELVRTDGVVAARATIDGSDELLARRALSFPDLAQGSYLLRVIASSGVDQLVVIVVE